MALKPNRRSRELIAEFENGFAKDWHMAVRDCFRDQLDIRYTDVVQTFTEKNGEKFKMKVKTFTQGKCYCFGKEHTIYDTPEAYNHVWSDCLKHVTVAYKITMSIPTHIKTVAVDDQFKKYLVEGLVNFQVLIPNGAGDRLVVSKEVSMSQSKFVELLQYGPSRRTPK